LLYKLNIKTNWINPNGTIVSQKYVKTTPKVIKTKVLNKQSSYTLIEPKEDDIISIHRQNNAIVPNLVHSMDSANISILVNNIIKNNYDYNLPENIKNIDKNYINLLTIHDCFATNANDVEFMLFHVKLAFFINLL